MVEYSHNARIGLQFKAILVMALIVVGGTVVAGWAYFVTVRNSMRQTDQRHARQAAHSLSLATAHALDEHDRPALQKLITDFTTRERVRYAALLNSDGQVLARSMRGGEDWSLLADRSIAVQQVEQTGPNALVVLWPVLSGTQSEHIVGGLRLVMDTGATTAELKKTQRRMGTVAVAVVLALLPLAHVLLRRLLVQPVEALAEATRRLARGHDDARSGIDRSDEIGQLAHAFDAMADHIDSQRRQLIDANEDLEHKVDLRTAELLEVNERLRETMSDKDDFLRAVSHDLNAPLRNIAGITTLVMMKHKDQMPEEVLGRLQRIIANVETETTLLGELLELSRIKTRRQKHTRTDVGQLAREVADTLEYDLQAKGITLSVRDNLPTLWLEAGRLRQVLQNLVDNAIKYMDKPTGGRVEIGCDCVDGFWNLWVQDNGPGVPEDQRQRVFHVFRRVEGPETEAVRGHGVGLAVVRTVAELYDGRAWVESVDGGGARFVLTLSEAKTNQNAHPKPAKAAA